ncbi:hypothetical protein A2533_03035 [Candidatus Falkowbacteria bacterium RIFOXYD2_FULL_35_9]|uniref:UDP-glucuronosyltransferase n=1 Tax=Candidatus Falkowbacteria bacterium RIFOXYC2_FULL_36_12 TaxID=1798002 RepID=A0A1F5SW14_9BACT|nr:MAG: hypothetical protein A2478_00420 [Candidatus Falkowbacteria bacterium RIFOXYC2_FULL_36_12]OGF31549.1 MAG: hypothetical protein A2300_03650 [Candidatus Falkowbacteria bacterium RIFOXYB2_FULL_35_7]OGF33601.1 MAG: hypothetical protein A2223_03555 [Candidatus Falkowbacteria bacterium RIFOXYA2_FULL_35_8]OGF46950.1 MAG: hypothetical protein A2533_03035 [Candidatus Falkowbacteria bacterium RIFOXYD2_FULL_35_9]
MAKIIYGVAGQGFGHAMRSKVIIDHLKQVGHEVRVLTYGQALPYLKKFVRVDEIVGLQLVYKNNKVDYLSTIIKDSKKFPKILQSFSQVSKIFNKFEPEVVISDYEPMSSILAHLNALPLLSIGNHHFITNCEIKFPKKYYRDYLTVKAITLAMTPKADAYFITTIAKEKIKDKKTFLFPPIVQEDVSKLTAKKGDFVLVYLTSEYGQLVEQLQKLTKYKFVVYGMNKNGKYGNVILKEFSRKGFVKDLSQSKAVIANSGFTFISEALFLKKPYFAIPVANQFEQTINAVYLEKIGVGTYSENFNQTEIDNFLQNLEVYEKNLKKYPKFTNQKLFSKLDNFLKKY